MSICESSSEEDSTEEDKDSRSSESECEAPLKKKSQQSPGSVLQMLTDHVKDSLDQGALANQAGEGNSMTNGVRIMTYFNLRRKPGFGAYQRELRDMFHLAAVMDTWRAGQLLAAGDVLAARFVALRQLMRTGARLDVWSSYKGPGRGGKGDWGWQGYKGEQKGAKGKNKTKGKGKAKTQNEWQGAGNEWKDKKEKCAEKTFEIRLQEEATANDFWGLAQRCTEISRTGCVIAWALAPAAPSVREVWKNSFFKAVFSPDDWRKMAVAELSPCGSEI